MVCGELIGTTIIDFKPRILSTEKEAYAIGADNNTKKSAGQEAQRTSHDFQIIPIGAASPVAWGGPASTSYTGPQLETSPIIAEKETLMSIDLNIEDSNPNILEGRADLFFQFHNDISHTKHRLGGSSAVENYIDLSVIPY